VAVELAIAMAYSMDPIIGRVGGAPDQRLQSYFNGKLQGRTLFADSPTQKNFTQRKGKSKLFL